MANVNHDQLSGSDLHVSKEYPTTGTPLRDWTQTDARYPQQTRTITTTAPLAGGGSLSADRTLSIPAATTTIDGYLKATDFASLFAHIANTGNPHNVTATQVGKNIAQWNANLLQSRALDNTITPLDGHVLTWDSTSNSWKPMAVQVPTLVIGPAGSGAKVQCSGVNDGATIKAAIAALPSGGAGGYRLFFLNGTYNWSAVTDKVNLTASNIIVEGQTFGGVIFKCSGSIHPGGTDSEARFGMVTIGRTQTSKISNIIIRNIVFDCNNQRLSAGFTISGSSATSGVIGVQNVICENILVKNIGQFTTDPFESGLFLIGGTTNSYGSLGRVDRVKMINCEVSTSQTDGMWVIGTNFTNLNFNGLWVNNCYHNGIGIVDYGTTFTSSDWSFDLCRFEKNMIGTTSGSMAHIRDGTQLGIDNLVVDRSYFGPTQNPTTTAQDYALTPYSATNTRITNCLFDRGGGGVSIGASISGAYNRIFPINRFVFENNILYRMRSCFDPDSTIFGSFRNNFFFEIQKGPILSPYSRHFPAMYKDNIFYNCNAGDGSYGDTDNRRTIFWIAADGNQIKDNYIIDDRKLLNPTLNLGVSQVAGGSLAARTYYVRYTWANDTGETLPTSSQTVNMTANNLLSVSIGAVDVPSGAKNVNIYVGTSAGSETLQGQIPWYGINITWAEPTMGLVTGYAFPATNTTKTLTKYGIYELPGGRGQTYPNIYSDNFFIGIETPIRPDTQYNQMRMRRDNFAIDSVGVGDYYCVEDATVDLVLQL